MTPSTTTGISAITTFDGKGVFGPRAARPMLSRDADAMYWMSRYVERAEHVARLLLVNGNLLIDVGDLTPAIQEQQWLSILSILRLEQNDEALKGDAPMGVRVSPIPAASSAAFPVHAKMPAASAKTSARKCGRI
jgi:hypothetical protein